MRDEQKLLIDDARAVSSADSSAFVAAAQLEAIRSCTSENQWRTGVNLWAQWLVRAEKVDRAADGSSYCGLREEGRSLAQDGYLMFSPLIAVAKGDDSLVPVAHMVAASGILSLGVDLIAFMPNIVMSTGKNLSRKIDHRRAESALSRFTAYVESLRCGNER